MTRRAAPALASAALVLTLLALSFAVPAQSLSVTAATGPPLAPPSGRFPFGTDEYGLSILALTVYGAQRSLLIGLSATAAAVGVGSCVGVLAGHFAGWADALLGRLTQWFLILPALPLALTLAAVLGPGIGAIVAAISVASWASTARVVRSAVVDAESQPYTDRARGLGASHWHQLRVHVLPAVLPVVVSCTSLTMANVLLSEATLSFLGLAESGAISWGGMLRQAAASGAATAGAWWYLLAPGCAITAVVLACFVAGRSAA